MALNALLTSKPPTPYFRPPPIHLCVVLLVEQPRVVAWEFDSNGARPANTKMNVLAALSDGKSVAKVTIFQEFAKRIKEGGSYNIKGLSLRGQSPPYQLNITKDTLFFRSAPIALSADLRQEAQGLIHPPSPLTPLSNCRDARGLITVEGEVVELSTLKEVTTGRDVVPLRNVTMKQGESQMSLCFWREAAIWELQVGAHIRVSHLKAGRSNYGIRLQSTNFSTIEELRSEAIVGALGVMEIEGEPGNLNLLLEDGRTVVIEERLWEPIEILMTDNVIKVVFTMH
ncbi:uncharacterized protein LOC134109760 [Pungitius pungitius]|uniref:uncharacterized protein LOC134109760 n=1 Tax=Pungitius pungitius TaxID=134920 RepID=UPI002E0D77AE